MSLSWEMRKYLAPTCRHVVVIHLVWQAIGQNRDVARFFGPVQNCIDAMRTLCFRKIGGVNRKTVDSMILKV